MIICSFVVFLILLLLYKKWQKTLLGENKNAHTENILPHCAVCCPDILWHFFKIMLSKLRERSTKFTWVTNKQNIVYFLPKAPHLSSLLFSLLKDHSSITSSCFWLFYAHPPNSLMIYSTVNHQEFPFFDPTHPPPWWRNTWMPP